MDEKVILSNGGPLWTLPGCPKCGQEQNCPCEACLRRGFTKPGDVVYKQDGDNQVCGNCGHSMHMGEWEDLEYNFYKTHGLWPSDNE